MRNLKDIRSRPNETGLCDKTMDRRMDKAKHFSKQQRLTSRKTQLINFVLRIAGVGPILKIMWNFSAWPRILNSLDIFTITMYDSLL